MYHTRKTAAAEKKTSKAKETGTKLLEIVKKMTEEQRAQIIAKVGAVLTVEGHPLSEMNTLFCYADRVAKQHAPLSIVGGFSQWKKHGRIVKKGEKGMVICFPSTRAMKNEDGEALTDEAGNEKTYTAFYFGYVFDISQTEELPAKDPADAV
ncbi:MAG: ArdC family protein [Candidatus Spyradenecus sp.]